MIQSSTRHLVQVKTVVATAAIACLAAIIFMSGSLASFAADHTIEIKSFKYVPDKITVQPGDTITWINRDIAPHTATAKDKSWDSDRLKRGESYKMIVTADMSMSYVCRFHPQMKASFEIRTTK